MRRIFVILAVLSAVPAAAQIQNRPTDPPIVTADNDSWYVRGEPILFAGEQYYPAGPSVFFNGNTMVRSGQFNGVPLYTETTVEPYSIVLVPISRGLMQPYEKPRRGQLAGTSGSRISSFTGSLSPEPAAPASAPSERTAGAVGTAGYVSSTPQPARPIVTLRRPQGNDGIWVAFGGEKWVSGGTAIPLTASDFVRVGEYAGFPVYARRGLKEDAIYLPARPGVVAPYRLKN